VGDGVCRFRAARQRLRHAPSTTVASVSEHPQRPGTDALRGKQQGDGRGWRFYLACFIALLALIIVMQNTESVTVTILFAETSMPLFFLLVVALLLGVTIGWLIPKVRGSKRHDEH
jgi:uncharacterized integral membrane protein